MSIESYNYDDSENPDRLIEYTAEPDYFETVVVTDPEPDLPPVNFPEMVLPPLPTPPQQERQALYPLPAPEDNAAFWPRLEIFSAVYERHKDTASTEDIFNLVDQIYTRLVYGKID